MQGFKSKALAVACAIVLAGGIGMTAHAASAHHEQHHHQRKKRDRDQFLDVLRRLMGVVARPHLHEVHDPRIGIERLVLFGEGPVGLRSAEQRGRSEKGNGSQSHDLQSATRAS